MLLEVNPTSLCGVVETTQTQWPKCFELDQPANDGMRQRLRQGYVEDCHGCNPQIQLLKILNLLRNIGPWALNWHSTINKSQAPSLSLPREVGVRKDCLRKLQYQLRPRMLVCAGGSFQMSFMLTVCMPYGRFNPSSIDGAGTGWMEPGCCRFCGGFRSDLCFDDWIDLHAACFSRLEDWRLFVVCRRPRTWRLERKVL